MLRHSDRPAHALLVVLVSVPLACGDPAASDTDDEASGSESTTQADTETGDDTSTASDSTETADTTDTVDTTDTGLDEPTCADGLKNQDETAIDCGGVCLPCADGLACNDALDCASGSCDDLVCGHKPFGVWGLGELNNPSSYQALLPALHGFHFRLSWAEFETAQDVYDSAYIAGPAATAVADGLLLGVMMIVAPTSSGNTPDYVFAPPFDVPLVQTDSNQSFPYYFDPDYQTRYFTMLDALDSEFASWDPDMLVALKFWQSAEGSTGDEGPYKGTPNNLAYDIPDTEWTTFKRDEVWTPMAAMISADLPGVALMVNQGNDGENFQWALDNLPGAWLKAGEFTHYYGFSGEGHYAVRLQGLADSPPDQHRVRGELEGVTAAPWWLTSPTQNTMAIVCSCLTAGVDILNVSPSNALADHAAYEFFNRYAGIRHASEGNVGFVALRDAIDLADLERFPEADYGPLVAPADQQQYDNRVANIVNSGQPDALIDTRLTQLLTSGKNGSPFLNAARIAAIQAEFPDAGYVPIEDGNSDSYHQDFGVDLIPGNYQRFVTQQSPHTTSVGVWRQGPLDSIFGRFGRRFDAASGKDELRFAIDPELVGEGRHRATITVTWLDVGAGTWTLQWWDGQTQRSSDPIVGADTGEVVVQVFELDDLGGGGHLTDAGDFALHHESGGDTIFFAVELERLAKLD